MRERVELDLTGRNAEFERQPWLRAVWLWAVCLQACAAWLVQTESLAPHGKVRCKRQSAELEQFAPVEHEWQVLLQGTLTYSVAASSHEPNAGRQVAANGLRWGVFLSVR